MCTISIVLKNYPVSLVPYIAHLLVHKLRKFNIISKNNQVVIFQEESTSISSIKTIVLNIAPQVNDYDVQAFMDYIREYLFGTKVSLIRGLPRNKPIDGEILIML